MYSPRTKRSTTTSRNSALGTSWTKRLVGDVGRVLFFIGLALAVLLPSSGCRSRAKQDVYVQRLSGEVRLLEDQLYEADYRNRVLAEKLAREKNKASAQSAPSTMNLAPRTQSYGPVVSPIITDGGRILPSPIDEGDIVPPPGENSTVNDAVITPLPLSDPTTDSQVPLSSSPADPYEMEAGFDDADLDSVIDAGQPVAPEDLKSDMSNSGFGEGSTGDVSEEDSAPGANSDDPFVDDGNPIQLPKEFGAGTTDSPTPPPSGDSRYELPSYGTPPGEPEPPGKDDLVIPPIIEGEIIPPPPGDLDSEELPGKVPGLPNSLRDLGKGTSTIPQGLSLHPGFSGAQQFYADDEADGLMLVVNVLDEDGRMMNLNDFDIDAELSVVALDPTKPGDEARIARWDFGPEEVKNLVRHVPVSGFHVPVVWDTVRPDADEVVVHVRLQSGDDRMACEGRVNVARNARVARWSPRAASSSAGDRARQRPPPARPSRRL